MSPKRRPVVALASSLWSLVSAWWNIDRIRVPHSRHADIRNSMDDERAPDDAAATARRQIKPPQTGNAQLSAKGTSIDRKFNS